MADDIRQWLEELGLDEYAEAFVENRLGFAHLPDLNEEDLRELGIVAMGDRKTLMRAIGELGRGEAASPPAARQSAEKVEAAPVPGGERRQLTVMFCDLVGSTELTSAFDPEDLSQILARYREVATEAINRFGGYVAKYMGDGVLAYFGYPQAHEHDAERAARSGLAIVQAIDKLNEELSGQDTDLAVRIGINSGPVVVGEVIGEGQSEELTVIGEAPNIAARLQSLAEPNRVVLGPLTHELVGRSLDCVDLGEHRLKGIAEPVRVWRVVAEREPELEDLALSSGVPLVGRDEEAGLLLRSWEQAREGHGQVVLISGEPGIGKSALVETVSARVREAGFHRVAMRCSPYHTGSTLYPVIEHLRRFSRWQAEDPAETRLEKLEDAFRGYSMPLDEVIPLFAGLLSLPLPEGRYPNIELSPQEHKQQMLDALVAWTLESAEARPFLMVWEDLHWADDTTVEFLGLLIDQAPTAALLLALTYRPDLTPTWPMRSHMMPITLNRLERAQVEAMVLALAGGRSLPMEVLDHIVAKTDGVPLFVEELTKMLLESGLLRLEGDGYVLTGPLSDLAIPATLQESLLARLDRLPTVREVAQVGAVLGREFAYETLKALGAMEDEALEDGLGRLVEAELLYQRGRPPRSRYIFKHALVQDAAYQSLLRRTRQHYHGQIAELLEASFPDMVENTPELVAHHFAEAGNQDRAVAYWQKAGARALAANGYEEALRHFRRGLVAKEGKPTDAETAELLFGLGRAQLATLEMDQMSEALDNFHRAFDHFAEVGDTEHAVRLAEYPLPMYLVVGQGKGLADLTKRALGMVPPQSNEAARLLSRYGFSIYMEQGDYEGAKTAFDRSLTIARRNEDKAIEMQTLISAANVEFYNLSWQDAADISVNAIELARSVENTRMEVYGRYYATAALTHAGDLKGARPHAEEMVRMAEGLHDRFWLAGAYWMANRVHRLAGAWQAARELLDRGLAWSPRDFRLLSDRAVLEFELGRFSEGEAYLDRMIAVVRPTALGPSVQRALAALSTGVIGRIAGETKHFDGTEEFAESVISSPSATAVLGIYARLGPALRAAAQGDVSAATKHYAALQPFPKGLTVYVTHQRVLGLLAQCLGQIDQAASHFEDGAAFCRNIGARPELAWICSDYADLLVRRDSSGDREKATAFRDEGLKIASELGMRPIVERIQSDASVHAT